MSLESRYDVVIAGGGLAGLCLAIQLRRAQRELSVLVVEPNRFPLREAAHKVGESSVEAASHYFIETLGIRDLLDQELPKFGLRFYFEKAPGNRLEDRLECGPSHYLSVPSFQIDRGQFENNLAERALSLGVTLETGARVSRVDLGEDDGDHTIVVKRVGVGESVDIDARWIVDSTGRAGLLRRKFGTVRRVRHRANAAWFRLDAVIDPSAEVLDETWQGRVNEPRVLSTNHLMGEGYWVWLIPLANGRMSIGIVADAELHDFSTVSNFEKALVWLEEHEPQVASLVRANLDRRMDFRAMKNYSHGIEQVFGPDRWAITGDAGVFIDPLYSPGSDFIGMSNTFVTELIVRDAAGDSIEVRTAAYDQLYRSLSRTFLVTYHRQYKLMGNGRVMSFKVIWDFAMYWGGPALLLCHDRITDLAFMERTRSTLQRFGEANVRMQAFFRDWNAVREEDPPLPAGIHVDYAEIEFLARLNRELLEKMDGEATLELLDRNATLALALKDEIIWGVTQKNPKLSHSSLAPRTDYLGPIFDALYPGSNSEKPA